MCLITVCFEQKVNFRTFFILHRLQPFTFHRDRDYNYTVFHQVHRLRKHCLTLRLCLFAAGRLAGQTVIKMCHTYLLCCKYIHICMYIYVTHHCKHDTLTKFCLKLGYRLQC